MYNWIILDTSTSEFYRADDMEKAVRKMEKLVNSVGVQPARRASQLVLLQRLVDGTFVHYKVVEIEWVSEVKMVACLK